ncbi:MAG: type II toxin-antitoxin system MqsA family antitoxin [Deltaproteobacteria bacterium]|nr:type II toxin-antitoxin system MqsA family antitoxin [Deltaproteobacteria bacterium]
MQCVFCGGKVKAQKVTFIYDNKNDYFFIKNAPAEVCVQCGEKTYSPEVADKLIRLAKKKLLPVKTIRVPVFEYAGLASS